MTLRVAYVCVDPGVPVFGTKGASVHVQEIIRAWRLRGAQVRVYCTRTGLEVPDDLAHLPVVHHPVDPGSRHSGERERAAERERAQAEVSARLAEQVLADGADVVYERYSLFSTALAQLAGTAGIPGVLEVNAPLIEEQRDHRVLVDEEGARHALRAQAGAARSVACVSAPVGRWVRDQVPGAPVVVAPNGVNTSRIQPVRPADGPPTVLFIGTLKPWHGVEALLEAAALAREDWRVRIVGDGPLRQQLGALAHRLGVRVDFRGAVPPQQVPEHMAGASVAVAPYPQTATDQYFSPLKVFEYAAAALPVVASAVGQLPQIIDHGHSGLLVPPSDPAALAAAIDALVADPARARALGRAARARVEREHSWTAVLDTVLSPLPELPDRAQVA